MPAARLPELVKGHVPLDALRPDKATAGVLLEVVQEFREASLEGEYYEDFDVNSKNYMEKSRGTETWIAECDRLFDRCVAAAGRRPNVTVRQAFEILLDLLRHIDQGHDDIIFFADEAGSWQVGVDWREVLPAYFACLAGTAAPDEYGLRVKAVVDFVGYDEDRYLKAARAAASPGQKKALRGARRGRTERG